MLQRIHYLIAIAASVAASPALAFVVAPTHYTTTVQVQGEAEGTEFDDWAGVPIAYADAEDNGGEFEGRPFMDFANLQVANDGEFLYLHMSYHNTSSVNTFIGLDLDADLATGFDLFGLGLIGSDIGYQNDFPFQQATGVYNVGVALTGGPLSNGGALIYTFWDQDGMDKEWAIPLDLGLGFPAGDPAFTGDTIDILFYTEEGAGDINDEVVRYTLAAAPVVQGDFNDDGLVDAADYTIWRDSKNDIGQDLPADGNGDMVVDTLDYDLWAANYGGGAAPVNSLSSAPEPLSATLALTALAGALVRRRRTSDLSNFDEATQRDTLCG
ncbi:hypothetical protein Pla123a_30880 [Posidoniimonas polymericola]|uniref:PEP-CTERM protein-sorting domain-containing protein n=1 Tax=Posidoniimonas polymericola TaxID=2528002 RepID=A0A5C5YLC7_9BACT|nr:hypothetical protein [Posidoniimonas polymericola]TWT75578.1 hypothetical protein Pla123a_30880 [Posidoniimonas polymericola]